MEKKRQALFGFWGTILFLIVTLGLTFALHHLTQANEEALAEYYKTSYQEEVSEEAPVEEELESPQPAQTETFNLTEALAGFDPRDPSQVETIEQIQANHSYDEILDNQGAIVAAIHQNQLNEEELGYLFLPEYPAETQGPLADEQMNIPLYLQKDIEWRELPYGNSTTQELGENGCAIVSLAMIKGYLDNQETSPEEILDWSEERYWVNNEGTSWQIFHEFAEENGYHFENLGNNFYHAMEAAQEGRPIVASVKPGYFTEVGHIIVIRGYKDGKVYVNDPNDDPEKMFSLQGIDEDILLAEGTNYWAFSN